MSHVRAYRCDYCGVIKDDEDVKGVSKQEDMFDRIMSYPDINNNAKADVHVCIECFATHVLEVANRTVNRKKDEHLYRREILSLSYALKAKAVANVRVSISWKREKNKV